MAASMYTKSIHRETVGRQTPLSVKDGGKGLSDSIVMPQTEVRIWTHCLLVRKTQTLHPLPLPSLHHHHQLARQQALLILLWHPMVVNVAGKKRQRAQNTASKHLSLPQLALGFQSDTWSLVLMGGMPLNQSDIQPTRRSSLTYAMSNSKKSFIGKCAWAWLHFKKNTQDIITLFGGVKCKAAFYKPRDYLPQKKNVTRTVTAN